MTLAADENPSLVERWGTRILIFVAIVLHTVALLNSKPLQSANDRSRWCTVWALVERGTFQIDEIRQYPGWDSIDIIYDDGHFYSTKPPLLTVIVAGVTWAAQKVTGWTLLDDTQALSVVVLIVINIIPFAVSLQLLARLLQRVTQTAWCRLFLLASAAFGTLVTPFLMTLNNHTVAVAGVMVSLYALERILSDEFPSAWSFALCGLASGWACANELPAAAFGLATCCLAARRSMRQTLTWYAVAAMVPIGAFLVTNIIATGSIKPTYANYGSSKYNFVIDGIPSYWMDPDGVDRNLDSPWIYFVHSTVGHHGIFSLTPLFLLALVGLIMTGLLKNTALRTMIRTGALMSAIVIAFYMTRFDNYNYGGVSCALRWALWLIPFWLLAMVPVVDAAVRIAPLRWLQFALLGVSMVSAWLPIENPWQQPWLFRRMEAWKWIDYTRKPPALPRTLWTWFLGLPEVAEGETAWVEFTSQTVDGAVARRRLSCRTSSRQGFVELTVLEATGTEELRVTRQMLIDVAQFESGSSTAEFVRWPESDRISTEQKVSDFNFVRALPLKKEYRAGKIRYLRLPLRNDAFRCQAAAAAVDYPQQSPANQYRCDTWLCEELPFGVAQYEIRVTEIDSGATVHQERWTVSSCSPPVSPTAPPPVTK